MLGKGGRLSECVYGTGGLGNSERAQGAERASFGETIVPHPPDSVFGESMLPSAQKNLQIGRELLPSAVALLTTASPNLSGHHSREWNE